MLIQALYDNVTAQIIAQLESGAAPWLRPWKNGRTTGLMPQNFISGRAYSGINVPILWGAASGAGYDRHEWLTFKQAIAAKACVRKGEKGTAICFMKKLTVTDRSADADEGATKSIPLMKTYYVFNVDQIDGLKAREPKPLPQFTPIESAAAFVAATGANIKTGGNSAHYVPSMDYIALPPAEQFKNPASYYATAFHELGHWTGDKARLDRNLTGRFGTQAYAAEELVAELCAAFTCAALEIAAELRHADYIANWIKLLKSDSRAIFTAAAKASQAANYLAAFSAIPSAEEVAEDFALAA